MSQPPPPGSPGGSPPPGSPAGAGAPPPGVPFGRALHKPGTVPLRPLTLGDFFDGAFATVRRNPRATIGLAAVVLAVAMVIPVLVAVVTTASGDFSHVLDPGSASVGFAGANVGIFGASLTKGLFAAVANIVIAGLVVPVVTSGVLGERLPPAAAWQRARPHLLRLVGLSLLEGLAATLVFGVLVGLPVVVLFAASKVAGVVLLVLGVLAAVALMVWLHIRWFQLAAPALVAERLGVLAAVRRAGALSRGQFWRILGLFVLLVLVTGVVQEVISIPFSILGAVLVVAFPHGGGLLGLLMSSDLATIVAGAVVTPFVGAVAVLQYVDQRFRKEGFDIELVEHVQRNAR